MAPNSTTKSNADEQQDDDDDELDLSLREIVERRASANQNIRNDYEEAERRKLDSFRTLPPSSTHSARSYGHDSFRTSTHSARSYGTHSTTNTNCSNSTTTAGNKTYKKKNNNDHKKLLSLEDGETSFSEVAMDDSSLVDMIRKRASIHNHPTSSSNSGTSNNEDLLKYKLAANGVSLESPVREKGKGSKNQKKILACLEDADTSEVAMDDSSLVDMIRRRSTTNNEDLLKYKLAANGISLESPVGEKGKGSKNQKKFLAHLEDADTSEVAMDDSSLLDVIRRHSSIDNHHTLEDWKLEANGITLEPGKKKAPSSSSSSSSSPNLPVVSVPGALAISPSGVSSRREGIDDIDVSSPQQHDQDDSALQMQEEGLLLSKSESGCIDDPSGASLSEGLSEAMLVDEDEEMQHRPSAMEVDPQAAKQRKKKENWLSLSLLANGFLCLAVIVLVVVIIVRDSSCDCDDKIVFATSDPTPSPTNAPSTQEEYILSLFPNQTISSLKDTDSAQYQAYRWLLNDPSVANYSDMRLVQRFSLATLFYATDGLEWYSIAKDGWLSYSLHECDWNFTSDTPYALTDGFGNNHYPKPENPCGVEALQSERNHHDELEYQYLWLPEAGLHGEEIPAEIFLLTSLKTLNLAANHISGTIPTEAGKLTDLEVLSLSLNPLSGSLPSEVGLCSNLSTILLWEQPMSGSIPSQIGQLKKLKHLHLRDVGLSGQIPSEIGLARSMEYIDMSFNGINGTIPSELFQLTSLWEVGMSHNHLSGEFPSEIGLLTSLEVLLLANNTLKGSLPTELGSISSLYFMSLRYNFLEGPIPSEFGLLDSLFALHLYENFLTGNLPTELGNMHDMEVLWLYDNSLSGSLPSELGTVSFLHDLKLQDNQFTSSLPSELGKLADMADLQLQRNKFSGVLPSEIGTLSMMYLLSLQGNQLDGQMPTEIGRLASAEALIFSDNSFSGTLPSQLGLLSASLTYLDVADNSLTGEIPEELPFLLSNPHLEGINLMGNAFVGELSGDFCTVDDSLFQFDCSDILCGCSCPCHDNSNLAISNTTNTTNN